MTEPPLRIDGDRLWASIAESATIGAFGDGLARLALTDADVAMRHRFISRCRDAGLAVTIDPFGTIVARREGKDPALPAVMFGSHLDTQAEGGRFDGVLGVLGGLEVVRTLNDHGIATLRPLLLVNWTNEEGARFSPPMLGSAAATGVIDADTAYAIVANDTGTTFGAELERTGFRGNASIAIDRIERYVELHIEQGPILEATGVRIGVVSHAATVHGFRFAFTGETAHAGTMPMAKRRNALVAAARFAAAIDDIGTAWSETGGMATVARIVASPNRPGILSNHAELSGDARHPDSAAADAMIAAIRKAAASTADNTRCEVALADSWHWGGDIFDAETVGVVRQVATSLGYSHRDLASQAGHDAYHVASRVPAAMIFVPCEDGITHHPAERIRPEDAEAGTNVLLHTVLHLANRPASPAAGSS